MAGPQSDPRNDRALVEAINQGDAEAFEVLYYRYRDVVASLAYRFTGNREDALDVLQETFAYLLRKFPGFTLTSKMTTFLYPVVRSLSANVHRKRGREVRDEVALHASQARDEASQGGSLEDLLAVMESLPAGQREVVVMRFVDDLNLAEIAESLAIPVGTVKSRLHHALAALRADERTRRHFAE